MTEESVLTDQPVDSGEALRTYPLTAPSFLDPRWFRTICNGVHPAIVAADRRGITLAGVELTFQADRPAPGTQVQVWLNATGYFVCARLTDFDAHHARRQAAEAAAEQARRDQFQARRTQAEAFNARLRVPVPWDTGIKDVLSGLSESSCGDGRSRATVVHIYLLEPLVRGRLKRQARDFLCTRPGGSNGRRWSAQIIERAYDGHGQPYPPQVTCKACLALAREALS